MKGISSGPYSYGLVLINGNREINLLKNALNFSFFELDRLGGCPPVFTIEIQSIVV